MKWSGTTPESVPSARSRGYSPLAAALMPGCTHQETGQMTDNIALLLTVLVAANVILVSVVVVRAWRRRRQEARFVAARTVTSRDALHPSATPRAYGPAVEAPEPPGCRAGPTR